MRTISALILAAVLCAAATRVLSIQEQMDAYDVSCQRIASMLKAPATARFAPISAAKITPGKISDLVVRTYVDAQNGYGAMIRTNFTCHVTANKHKPPGHYQVFCRTGAWER